MSKELENKLLDMKDQIDDAKTKASEIKGALDELYRRLKSTFGLTNLNEVENKIKKMEINVKKLEEDLQEKVEQLEKDYNWS